MRVAVIAVSGCFDSGLTSVLDVLRVAETLRPTLDREIPPVEVEIAGFRRRVKTAGGLLVPVERLLREVGTAGVDLLVVPGLGATAAEGVERELIAPGVCELRGFLAETGIELDMPRMLVDSGPIATAGAAFAYVDLAVSIVSRVSPQLADLTARHLLVDERPARSIDVAIGHLAATDELVAEFEAWNGAHLDQPVNVAHAATQLGTTRRTLERRVRSRTGMTPHALVQRLRFERARHLRRTTTLSIEQIAPRVGYQNGSTLHRLRRKAG